MGLEEAFDSAATLFTRKRHEYTAVPTSRANNERLTEVQRLQARKYFKLAIAAIIAVFVLFFTASYVSSRPPSCQSIGNCTDTSPHLWGQYSPFFSVPSEIRDEVPDDCRVSFALVLSRHGARDPTAHKSDLYKAIIERVQASAVRFGRGVEFIKDYKYSLGAEKLTAFGVQQMVDSGRTFRRRYQHLVDDASDPFVRAAGSQRVVESGAHFLRGFYNAGEGNVEDKIKDMLVIPEEEGFNNTLNHGTCTAFEEGPASETREIMQTQWKEAWVPRIAERLNRKLPGANLTLDETVYMMDLCPFNVVADPDGKRSPFCNLFSEDEWRSYDYFMSLDKWYGYGQGNSLGPTQGVGYVNELIARLMGQPVEDSTSTNTTLDSSQETFPLDKALFADFSHDNLMASVHAALGLYNHTADLPVTHKVAPADAGGFSAAWTVPFAGRMYVEKLKCGDQKEEMVRILVNDRVVPLRGCGATREGMCTVSGFVASLSFAKGGGLWDQCQSPGF